MHSLMLASEHCMWIIKHVYSIGCNYGVCFAEKSPFDLHTFCHKSNVGFTLAYQYNVD